MPEAQQDLTVEIDRLNAMSFEAFRDTVVAYVTGATDRRCPREVQGPALESPVLAVRTLDALEDAMRLARTYLPRQEGESKREQQARIAPFRAQLAAAMPPLQFVVDDLAHEEAKVLAALDEETFTRRWSAFVREADPGGPVPRRILALAYRSPRVAARAETLCRLMVEEPARFLSAEPGESRTAGAARVAQFREKVESEARLLRFAVQYAEARLGQMPSAPNPRQHALRLLGQAHPEELVALVRQVREGARADKKQARRDARDVRRSAR
ncbi:hypothetical protein ACIO3O_37210 [Streptomyces sp. NPDC087440]|uniref:hypothetical protein n=1 Tax=Streptomyces sp. NPDC087440 TaxID=3365790 RepID=UPI003822D322